jgi:formate dehydrogenase maturation protein FdhE
VDLRKEGHAVPLVDELAAVELDIWAQERGLTKLRENVLGL